MKKAAELNTNLLPKHVAIIMDGNGRWAAKRMLPHVAGHRAGANALENISNEAEKLGINHLTVFAFSTENWKRSETEVNTLMNLIREYLDRFYNNAVKRNIKIDFLGDLTRLDEDIRKRISSLTDVTSMKQGMNLHIALNYGGRDEILRAVKKISTDVVNGTLRLNNIDENTIGNYLDTKDIPDPELLIRTSNELRISNFLLWQLAYCEFYFSEKLWPDFTVDDLKNALIQYQNRSRRFGGRL